MLLRKVRLILCEILRRQVITTYEHIRFISRHSVVSYLIITLLVASLINYACIDLFFETILCL